jgi:hypothetical protein
MNFAEQSPSKQWAALKYRGEVVAEVWFKPEGEPAGLTFRVHRESFHIPGMGQQLTAENLLKAVGIAAEEVDSWRHAAAADPDAGESDPELSDPLPPPAHGVPHLEVHVRLKVPSRAAAGDEPEVAAARWHDLEALWKAILGLESTVETLRISMEGVRAEMETAARQNLTTEQKQYALRADVAQWEKARGRVHYALPKARDYIHRATWALGAPERKQLEELYKSHIRPKVPFPQVGKVLEQLENMRKDRQVLSAHGVTVLQECKGVAAAVQGALRTLQSNAAAKAAKTRGATGVKGKLP